MSPLGIYDCRLSERLSRIKTRLLELGYNEEDIWDIRLEPSVVRDAELTSEGMQSMLSMLSVLTIVKVGAGSVRVSRRRSQTAVNCRPRWTVMWH